MGQNQQKLHIEPPKPILKPVSSQTDLRKMSSSGAQTDPTPRPSPHIFPVIIERPPPRPETREKNIQVEPPFVPDPMEESVLPPPEPIPIRFNPEPSHEQQPLITRPEPPEEHKAKFIYYRPAVDDVAAY